MSRPQDGVDFWIREIDAAKKREKDWRKEGVRVNEIYGGKKKGEIPFNILFSNTETLLPALYSATPRPVVMRRYRDEDPLGKAAGEAGKRALEFLLDTDLDGYETYDEAVQAAVLDALLPGRGVTAVKYDAELSAIEEAAAGEEEDAPAQEKKSELVCCETWKWDRVLYGYATKWGRMPWIAYEMYLDREEATEKFGAANAAKLTYAKDAEEKSEGGSKDEDAKGEVETALVYQIWDKHGGRKVRYYGVTHKDGFLRVLDDPLGFSGFFNCPRPIQFVEKSNDLAPVAPYALYEQQAQELNELTRRITHVVKAIKARAIYDTELGDDVKKLLDADDLDLVPTENSSSIASEKGLQNALWFWPVEKLIVVLQQLYAARESCKQVIFEIMGLADIMRGASQASETLGAQQIKQAWGSLRIRRPQKEVQRYCVDLLRMMLEVAASKFSESTWARMTGLDYLTVEQAAQAGAALAAAQMAARLPGPDGQPNPQALQALAAAQAQVAKPRWADVLALLRDDIQRAYKIDIETNSTLEPEAVEDQKNIADVMNALGQYLNGVTPLIERGVFPFEGAKAMMLAIVRRFRFGDEIENYIQQMRAPAAQDAGAAEAAKSNAEAQRQQAELAQKAASEDKDRAEKAAADQRAQATEVARINATVETERIRQASETEREAARAEFDRRSRQSEMAQEQALAKIKAAAEADSELRKAALAGAVSIEVARIGALVKTEADTPPAPEAGMDAKAIESILATQERLIAAVMAPRERIPEIDPRTGRISRVVESVRAA